MGPCGRCSGDTGLNETVAIARQGQEPSRPMKQRPLPVTLGIGLSTFLTLFDVTAVVVTLPGIAKDRRSTRRSSLR